MRRLAFVFGAVLSSLGCGGGDSAPPGTPVTVTVLWECTPLANHPVTMAEGVDGDHDPPIMLGVLDTRNTDSQGQVTFMVPASTSTGEVWFTTWLEIQNGSAWMLDHLDLNALGPLTLSGGSRVCP